MADKDVMDLYSKDYEEHSQDDGEAIDLYDDVMDPVQNENSGNSTPHSEENTENFHYTTYSGKRYQLYVGNLTWWTTDQDIADAVRSLGVQDFLEVKFFENRANGQSKGFCLVSLGSDESSRICIKGLPKKTLHGQNPIVTYTTKQALSKFENEAKLRSPAGNNKQGPPNQMQRGQQQGVLTNTGPPDQGPRPQHHQPPPHFNQQWPHNGMRPPGPPRVPGPPHHMQQQGPPQPPPGMFQGPPRMQGPPMDQHGPPPPRPDWARPPGMQGPGGYGHGHMVGQGMQGKHPAAPPMPMHQGPPPPRPAPPPQGMPPNQGPPGPYFQQAPPPRPPPPGPSMDFGPPPPQPRPHHPPMQQYPMGGQQPPPHQQQPMVPMDKQPQFSELEFEEIMSRNRTVSSSAISRAISDAATGEFTSAIETLVTAISLIKQSKISNDDRCKILISSLQDTLHGVEAKNYASSRRERSRSRERAPHRRSRRSRSRERSRDRYYGSSESYGRERSRSRERDRERSRDDSSRYYEERYRDREKERDRERERERDREGRHSERERERESTRTSSRH